MLAREGETLQVGAVLAPAADASVSDAELDEFVARPATAKPAAPGPEAAAPDVAAQAGAKPASVVSPPSNSPEPCWADRHPRQSARCDRCDSG